MTLYNKATWFHCLPPSSCTDNDCTRSHSFIFLYHCWGFNLFPGLFVVFLLLFWKGLTVFVNVGVCACVCVCFSLLIVCAWERERLRENKGVCCFVARNAHQPFACVHHCAGVFRFVQVFPFLCICSSKWKRRGGMKRRWRRRRQKRAVSIAGGVVCVTEGSHKEECKFLSWFKMVN